MTYSFLKGLGKSALSFLVFLAPFILTSFIDNFPAIANLTIGAVLTLLVNYLKVKGKK